MITHVTIEPGHGHSDENGRFDPGNMLDNMHEVDLIDSYVHSMIDRFLGDGLYHEVIKTRKHPGMKPAERYAVLQPRTMLISCHIGWMQKPTMVNEGVVRYHDEKSKEFAHKLSDIIGSWGKKCSPNYQHCRVVKSALPILRNSDAEVSVQIEPFMLNGIDPLLFVLRLTNLGSLLGKNICSIVRAQNPKAGVTPWTLTRPT